MSTQPNVVGLDGQPIQNLQQGEPDNQLIEVLEQLLGMAKSGKIQSLSGAGFTSDGNRYRVFVTNENIYEELGSLTWLQQEYIHRVTGRANG